MPLNVYYIFGSCMLIIYHKCSKHYKLQFGLNPFGAFKSNHAD